MGSSSGAARATWWQITGYSARSATTSRSTRSIPIIRPSGPWYATTSSATPGVDDIGVGTDVNGNPAAVTDTLILRNTAIGAGDDGIDVDSAETTLTRNGAFRNDDLGIEAVPGVTDGGGNKAAGNGNPLQCTNVFCR